MTAGAAADTIDDLGALEDPDAAGARDAFHDARREALTAARDARDTAPEATAAAFALSLDAAAAAERLGDALVLALNARDDLAAARGASDSDAFRDAWRERSDAEDSFLVALDEWLEASDLAGFGRKLGDDESEARATEDRLKAASARVEAAGAEATAAGTRAEQALAVTLLPFVERAAAAVEVAEARREEASAAYRNSVSAWRALEPERPP